MSTLWKALLPGEPGIVTPTALAMSAAICRAMFTRACRLSVDPLSRSEGSAADDAGMGGGERGGGGQVGESV